MLIRSQDKRMIVNFENICTVSAFPEKDSEDIYVKDGTGSLMVGIYWGGWRTMNKRFFLTLGIASAVHIVADIICQKWDVLVINIIACVLCFAIFVTKD